MAGLVVAWLLGGCNSGQLASPARTVNLAASSQPAEISQDLAVVKASAEVTWWSRLEAAAKLFSRDVVIEGDGNRVAVGGVWRYVAIGAVLLWLRPFWRRPAKLTIVHEFRGLGLGHARPPPADGKPA